MESRFESEFSNSNFWARGKVRIQSFEFSQRRASILAQWWFVVLLVAIGLHNMFACLLQGHGLSGGWAWLGPFSFLTIIAYRCCSVCVRAYACV
jgi:hypothetical protein